MTSDAVLIAEGFRTPFGRFGGGLRDATVAGLAVQPMRAALDATGLDPASVDHVVFGNTLGTTPESPFASRVATLRAGLPLTTCSLNVNRACGTGLQAIVSAAEQILLGRSEVAVAAGAEVFSAAPHALRVRWGVKRGVPDTEDMLDWAYRDPFTGLLMGETAENLSDACGIGRDAQDAYALRSQQRAGLAQEKGWLGEEIIPVGSCTSDEFLRPQTTAERLAAMEPAFRRSGRVTAGNSSGINDGGAAVVVLSERAASRLSVRPRARVVDWAVAGVEPELMGRGPIPATRLLLDRVGITADALDVCEVNEAFAVVVLHAVHELGLDPDRTNPNGGAIAIGHPPGATGLRMVLAAMNELRRTGGRYGLVTMCLGAGQGMAMLLESLER